MPTKAAIMEDLNSVEVVEALVVEIEKMLKSGGVKETEADLIPKLRAAISKLPVLNRQDTYTLRKTAYDFWNLAVEMGQKKVTAGDLNPKSKS
jgi:imidazolonepropionase-like amidohydrolase